MHQTFNIEPAPSRKLAGEYTGHCSCFSTRSADYLGCGQSARAHLLPILIAVYAQRLCSHHGEWVLYKTSNHLESKANGVWEDKSREASVNNSEHFLSLIPQHPYTFLNTYLHTESKSHPPHYGISQILLSSPAPAWRLRVCTCPRPGHVITSPGIWVYSFTHPANT